MSSARVSSGNCYAAVIVYESASLAAGYRPLYEETITVVRAESSDQAWDNARRFAESREATYKNENNETITVSLKKIVDVSAIVDDLDGEAEVYTRHFRDYSAYESFEPLLSGEPL